jgi:predicted PurR-regulated permease PerM
VSIVILIIQTIDAWYLQPYVIGSGVGLPPLVTMLALAISGSVAGISGLVLAVPAAVIIKVIGSELYHELYDRS